MPSFITQIKCMATTATANTDARSCKKLATWSLFVTLPSVNKSIAPNNIAISASHGIILLYENSLNISRNSICSSRNKSTDAIMSNTAPIVENTAARYT